jgi:D-alanine-D-alanine ligase-like ATP-grasp enzyme
MFTLPRTLFRNGYTSLGVSLADGAGEREHALMSAASFDANVWVEERLAGRELTCAVLEELDGSARALPVIEISGRPGLPFGLPVRIGPAVAAVKAVR